MTMHFSISLNTRSISRFDTARMFARSSSLRSVDCHGQFEALEDCFARSMLLGRVSHF
jgi:hypothetical protein